MMVLQIRDAVPVPEDLYRIPDSEELTELPATDSPAWFPVCTKDSFHRRWT